MINSLSNLWKRVKSKIIILAEVVNLVLNCINVTKYKEQEPAIQFRLIPPEITVIRIRLSHARRESSGLAVLLSNT